VTDQRAANAARVRRMTVGLVVAGVVGTGAFGGLAWAQDHHGTAEDVSTGGSTSDSYTSGGSGSSTSTWPQLSSGSGSSHTRSSGS